MFHKHIFQQSGLNLWCFCGKTQVLKCSHEWRVHNDQMVRNWQDARQQQQTLICKNCGDIKCINLTTGWID